MWSEIKKSINSNLDLPLNELIEKKFGGLSVVKSVQRGIATVGVGKNSSGNNDYTTLDCDIIINDVTLEKTIVNIQATGFKENNSGYLQSCNGYAVMGYLADSNTLRLCSQDYNQTQYKASWEIIEFY